jgi:hypothetical protein
MMGSPLLPPHYAISMLVKDGHDSLHAKEQIGEKAGLVTTDTGASMTTTRSDITSGLLERDPPTKLVLQMLSGETLPILKEASMTLTLG